MRIIYYWAAGEGVVFLLFLYPKNRQDDLPPRQLNLLRKLVREEFR